MSRVGHRCYAKSPQSTYNSVDPSVVYDISKIDFDRLRQEFERTPAKKTTDSTNRMPATITTHAAAR